MIENIAEQEKISPMELKELKSRIAVFREESGKLEDEENKKNKQGQFDKIRERYMNSFIYDIMQEKDRFKNIFQTESGSIYFVLESGQSLRIKKSFDKRGHERKSIEPIRQKIIFLNQNQVEEFQNRRRWGNFEGWIVSRKIKLTDINKKEVYPFEFGLEGLPEINYDADKNYITINGDEQKTFSSGFHIGHRITEIIK